MPSLKFVVFILLTVLFSSNGKELFLKGHAEGNKLLLAGSLNGSKISKKSKKPIESHSVKKPRRSPGSDPGFDHGGSQTKGIILKFDDWPNEKERALILQEAKKAGLKKTKDLAFLKVWVFEWTDNELKDVIYTHFICAEFPKMPSLEYCRPNILSKPRIGIERIEPAVKREESHFHISKTQGKINEDNCNIICKDLDDCPYKSQNEKLHPYWAQRMIGTDLLKEKLKKQPEKDYIVAVFDHFDSEHGPLVQNLISGQGGWAVLPRRNKLTASYDSSLLYEYTENIFEAIEEKCGRPSDTVSTEQLRQYHQCKRNLLPSFINYSMSMMTPAPQAKIADELEAMLNTKPGSKLRKKYIEKFKAQPKLVKLLQSDFTKLDETDRKQLEQFQEVITHFRASEKYDDYAVFKKLSPDTAVVLAGGYSNMKYGSSLQPIEAQASKDYDLIIVGSLDADGRKSYFSQPHREVHIMAPAGDHIFSADKEGTRKKFGGTSAAAPLVTGSLAGFTWLSGYSPTPKEAKILLEKTAIPMEYSNDKSRENGVGMVNAYKLGIVGKQLKQICGTNISCFKEKIRDPFTYKFPEDQKLEEDVYRAFPECNPTCGGISNDSCSNKAEVFTRLRQAVFLNPDNKKLWTSLTCIYGHRGFKKTSLGAANTYRSLFGPHQKNNREAFDVCRQDTDCVLVPPCEDGKGLFSAMTKVRAEMNYALQRCPVLCNGKCRCDQTEMTGSKTKGAKHVSQCVHSKCVLKSESWNSNKDSPAPQNMQKTYFHPSGTSGKSGQR